MSAMGGVAPRAAWEAASAAVEAWALAPVADSVGVCRRDLCGRTPRRLSRRDAFIRKLAVYVAVCGLGASQRGVAEVCGLVHTTCGPFVRDLEDLRDDPEIDGLLDRLTADALILFEHKAAA